MVEITPFIHYNRLVEKLKTFVLFSQIRLTERLFCGSMFIEEEQMFGRSVHR